LSLDFSKEGTVPKRNYSIDFAAMYLFGMWTGAMLAMFWFEIHPKTRNETIGIAIFSCLFILCIPCYLIAHRIDRWLQKRQECKVADTEDDDEIPYADASDLEDGNLYIQ
jgi:hypothetical protein